MYLEDYGVVEPALEYAVPRGDVDGDGTADLAINAHDFTRRSVADCEWKEPRFCYDGAVFLVNGPFEGQINLLDEPDAISGGGVFSFLGQSISGGPDTDLNLDGRSDLVVSAKGPTAEDVALVLFGVGAP